MPDASEMLSNVLAIMAMSMLRSSTLERITNMSDMTHVAKGATVELRAHSKKSPPVSAPSASRCSDHLCSPYLPVRYNSRRRLCKSHKSRKAQVSSRKAQSKENVLLVWDAAALAAERESGALQVGAVQNARLVQLTSHESRVTSHKTRVTSHK